MPQTTSFIRIPPLLSGGIILSYRCTNTCKHCLYRCSPGQPDEWMTPEMAERIFSALQGEKTLAGIHFAGGEATMNMDCLEMAIRMAVQKNIALDYLETNGWWCSSVEAGKERFLRLREAGLPAVLVSVSPFHNEFIPFAHTRNCIDAAFEVFGSHGVMIYTTDMYQLLSGLPADERRSLDAFAQACRLDGLNERFPALYYLTPGGRVCESLRDCYKKSSPERWADDTCRRDLLSTSHFHIDLYGNLITGLCPGLCSGTVDEFHPIVSRSEYPLSHRLIEEGPYGLMRWAQQRHGYRLRREGYISKCDLCMDVRRQLRTAGDFPELKPDCYYTTE